MAGSDHPWDGTQARGTARRRLRVVERDLQQVVGCGGRCRPPTLEPLAHRAGPWARWRRGRDYVFVIIA